MSLGDLSAFVARLVRERRGRRSIPLAAIGSYRTQVGFGRRGSTPSLALPSGVFPVDALNRFPSDIDGLLILPGANVPS